MRDLLEELKTGFDRVDDFLIFSAIYYCSGASLLLRNEFPSGSVVFQDGEILISWECKNKKFRAVFSRKRKSEIQKSENEKIPLNYNNFCQTLVWLIS